MFEGLWRSATGAEIRLLQCGDAVSGTYTVQPAERDIPQGCRMLVGAVKGDNIGFVTSSAASRTIKSWTGHLVQPDPADVPELHAVCHTTDWSVQQPDLLRTVTLKTVVFRKADP
ncbi:avidin/streptavidin family protein [Methylobacterium sp. P31]